MIEAELKARLREPARVRSVLASRAEPEHAVYQDTYYDSDGRTLDRDGRELRLRTKTVGLHARHLLTYKEPAVDATTGSKPEHETVVADRGAVETMLHGLGYREVISLTKHCENYAFTDRGRDVLATLATVPELSATYLEVETIVPPVDVDGALSDLRALLADLGVSAGELTTELYTEAVAAQRCG